MSSNTLPFHQQAIYTMHKLEFKKAALKLREKNIALKEYKLKIKKKELDLLKWEKQFLSNWIYIPL